jgi:hypothetical protein
MTTRLSLTHKLPDNRWRVPRDPDGDFPGWSRDVAFLRRMWELGQDTILETAFYEPFVKPVRQLWVFDWHLE